ncbi:competence protein CoiA [Ignavigranum ruoffiae]|uniref:competence protein CoiA n=1 Tax=Ignavigranum ruoffiae TaxID=89093 RepID=UPI0024ACDDEE|nr:competence protein CoiA family protein [Ignavigranum ruoffiae]
MHFALDRNSQYISAERAYQESGSAFFCPRCQQTLIIKESKLGRHFFAHRWPCQARIDQKLDINTDNETEAHRAFKKYFVNYFRQKGFQAESEHYDASIQQFADVWLTLNSQTWIIEYQKSPIPTSILAHRHQAYLSQSNTIYWIMEKKKAVSTHSQFSKNMIHFDSTLGYFRLCWDERFQQLYIQCLGQTGFIFDHIKPNLYILPAIHLCHLSSFTRHNKIKRPEVIKKPTRIYHQRKVQAILTSQAYRPYLHDLYQLGISVAQLPEWIFSAPLPIFIDSPAWLYWTWIARALQAMDSATLIHCLADYLDFLEKKGSLKYADLPLIRHSIKEALLQATIHYLRDKKIDD